MGSLRAFAVSLCGDKERADDLVQETLFKAWNHLDSFKEGTNLKAWLFTIMRNSFNSRWRKSRWEVVTGPEVIELDAVTSDTQEVDLWARQVAERLLHDSRPRIVRSSS